MNQGLIDQVTVTSCIAAKIQKSNRIINNIFRKHFKETKLSNSQISILFILFKRKTMRQRDLAEILFLEKSTVKRNIERLIKQELLTINENNLIERTPKTEKVVNTVLPLWRKAMDEAEKKLGDEGMKSLDTLTQTLTKK